MNMSSNVKPRTATLASRLAYLFYSLSCYFIFLLTILYLIGFVGGLVVPKNINSGDYRNLPLSILIDIALITLFGLQHSVMARQGFKARLAQWLPPAMERATYVLSSSLMLLLLFYLWQPIPMSIWSIRSSFAATLVSGLFWAGWLLISFATFLISHSELFGVSQAIRAFRRTEVQTSPFITPSLYKMVRHPMYLGFLIAFWATPNMTVGHLVFALTCTIYILIGTHFEERDLVRTFGNNYLDYQQRVGKLLPFWKNSDDV